MSNKEHQTEEYKIGIINRLKRIEGQIRGLQKMVEENRNCSEILIQLSAVKGALNKTTEKILKEYTKVCIVEYEESGNEKLIEELIEILSKFKEV